MKCMAIAITNAQIANILRYTTGEAEIILNVRFTGIVTARPQIGEKAISRADYSTKTLTKKIYIRFCNIAIKRRSQ